MAGVVSECALVVVAIGLGHLGGVPAFDRFRLEPEGAVVGAVGALPMLALLLWCLRTTWGPMRRLVALVEERLGPHLANASMGGIVALAMLAGIGEELLFRGVIQVWLADRVPSWVAVAGAIVFILGNLASALASGYGSLLALRIVAAFGGGTVMVICMASAAASPERDRVYGLWVCGQLVLGALGLWLLPGLFAAHGLAALYVGLAVLMGLCLPLLPRFPLPRLPPRWRRCP